LDATQHALFGRYRQLIEGEGSAEDSDPLRMQEVEQFGQFNQALAAAQTDTYEVHEVRRQWLLVQHQRQELMETLERWRESIAEIRGLDLRALMPNIVAVGDEVERRFQQIGQMLDGTPPKDSPEMLDIATDKEAVRGLSHFETAALAVARTQMLRIEETLNKAADGELTERDAEHFYRLLGAYRGLSEATIAYTASADGIDWTRWREARF
jgi:hypothetical protein